MPELVIADELQQEIRLNYIEDALMVAYARCIVDVMPEHVTRNCYGCNLWDPVNDMLYDHPSQLHHNVCVMMSQEDQVDLCFEDALKEVDNSEEVDNVWRELRDGMLPPATWIECSKFLCKDWRWTEWITEDWKEKVKKMVCRLME